MELQNFFLQLYNLLTITNINSEFSDHYKLKIPDFIKDTFHCDHDKVLSENGNDESVLSSEYNNNDNSKMKNGLLDTDPVKVLNDIRQKHSNR